MDKPSYSNFLPRTTQVEPDDDDEIPQPPLRRPVEVEEDSSDHKDETVNRIVVEDVEDDDKDILEEAPPLGRGNRVRTPPE